jgi:hypothetical protein
VEEWSGCVFWDSKLYGIRSQLGGVFLSTLIDGKKSRQWGKQSGDRFCCPSIDCDDNKRDVTCFDTHEV